MISSINKFHDLIAYCDKKGRSAISDKLKASVKFDLGTVSDLDNISELSSFKFYDLPFDICTFQVYDPKTRSVFLVLCEKHDDGQLTYATYLGQNEKWLGWQNWLVIDTPCHANNNLFLYSFCDMNTGSHAFVSVDTHGVLVTDFELIPHEDRVFVGISLMVAASVELFSCSNVKTTEHHPSERLNKSRKKKGKPPFFSYHTLHITGELSDKSNQGGTHESPRLHLRRGHIRTLKSGIKAWVRRCLVGDKTKGFVGKDYKVEVDLS